MTFSPTNSESKSNVSWSSSLHLRFLTVILLVKFPSDIGIQKWYTENVTKGCHIDVDDGCLGQKSGYIDVGDGCWGRKMALLMLMTDVGDEKMAILMLMTDFGDKNLFHK